MGKLDDWETNAAGRLVTQPLYKWSTAPAEIVTVVRLEFFRDAIKLAAGEADHVQLTMSPAQCRELGEALIRAADGLSTQH